MRRIGLAFRAFFAVIFGSVDEQRLAALLSGQPTAAPDQSPPSAPKQQPAERNDAIGLLAALQREARLVDLVQEPLSEYSDDQIGAAARDVLRDSREVLARMFAIEPVLTGEEGASIETPPEVRAARIRIVGSPGGDPPYQGRLVHPGWQATRCDLPSWTGDPDDAKVIAPAEVEC